MAAGFWRLRRAGVIAVRRQLLRFGLDLVKVADGVSCLLPEIRQVMRDTGMLLNGCEAYQVIALTAATAKIAGAIAEVGVYRGGSARLICQVKGDRPLHLFDSFEGLSTTTAADSGSRCYRGQFRSNIDSVRQYLSEYSNVFFHRGWFPDTAAAVEDERFSFVHLDVDLYEPTRAGLEFFYPRLSSGGVLLSHDYYFAGVQKAFTDFFADKPEIVVPQAAGSQCFLIKLPTGPSLTSLLKDREQVSLSRPGRDR